MFVTFEDIKNICFSNLWILIYKLQTNNFFFVLLVLYYLTVKYIEKHNIFYWLYIYIYLFFKLKKHFDHKVFQLKNAYLSGRLRTKKCATQVKKSRRSWRKSKKMFLKSNFVPITKAFCFKKVEYIKW